MPVCSSPMPAVLSADVVRQIETLRAGEAKLDRLTTEFQRQANWIAWLYPSVSIRIDPGLLDAPYKALHPDLGWRRGRDGMVPSRANIENPVWVQFVISCATAVAIIKRDAVMGANVVSSARH